MIPLYNKEPHIKRALDSVISQTIQDFEIIVVNDGSTDKSADIVKSFNDARIRLINQKNAGVSVARNRGINEAKADLIAFLDADDTWMPDYLETILRLRVKYPYAGLYATSMKTELDEESGEPVPNEGLILNYFKVCMTKDVIKRALFNTCSATIPKKIFSEIGGFQTSFWWGEDVDMWGRIALEYPIAYNNQVCAIYYQNVVNSSSKRRRPVKIHPFVKTGREALKLGSVPDGVIKDLEEYIQHIEMYTAKHNIQAGDKNLAFNLLTRNDFKLAYKKILLSVIILTTIENNFPTFSKFVFKNNVFAGNILKTQPKKHN
ncbi:glycosyltransferase family A protein [Methanosarcina sp.]|uniref:glycosyltransferase family 2 protein n=1 Tax=Methanosarcina sp. TaxID=2213 RepID=UPI002AB8148E|nr:glycosyltransferase family A protein [Methanosarcina sp.]MDY9927886.1 glycosyltransferase family A protein [Methanosarcina sp.]